MRWSALALLGLGLVAGCRKEPLHEEAAADWDPPTPSNGFRPVNDACQKIDAAGQIQNTLSGSLQEVGTAKRPMVVAADDRFVYWVEGKNSIRRAERASSVWPRPWIEEPFVEGRYGDITDLAVTAGHVHWVERIDGKPVLVSMHKLTREVMAALPESSQPTGKLRSSGSSVFFSARDGAHERSDDGATSQLTADASLLVAVDRERIYTLTSAGFLARHFRNPWLAKARISLVAATDVVDAVSDGTFVYWLERGPETPADRDCERCSNGYETRAPTRHARGKLRRVPVDGGSPAELFAGLPDVEALTMQKGILWISSAEGLLRYDPTCHLPPARVAPTAGLHGRAAPFGDGLAVVAEAPAARVVLFASP